MTSATPPSLFQPDKFNAYFWASFSTLMWVSYLVARSVQRKYGPIPRGLPYPPGPPSLPLVGNLFDIARGNECAAAYQKLAQRYGDLVFLSVFGKHVLFVNSFETAHELFDKRSSNYSDRNESTMANELMGWDFSLGHMPYGERWRVHRRMFHKEFQQSVAHVYWPIQRREAHVLLRNLLRDPTELFYHLRHNAAAVILGMTYGIDVLYKGDRFVTVSEKAIEGMGQAACPGAFLVDLIPALKHVPDWFPGASFKHKAREWRQAVVDMKEEPFQMTKQNMKQGKSQPSFVSNILTEVETTPNAEAELEVLKNCAAMAYVGGAESTVSTIASFVLAMVMYPHVLLKAHEELDRVVGRDRLPEFSDRPLLPYIDAILKETLRWNPVAPLGLPHMATEGDEFRGYFIPAGTIVVGNTWGILHDAKTFPDPLRFNPERFMNGNTTPEHLTPTDVLSSSFGYGRRHCPGRHVGDATVWISIVCILAAFDIAPSKDQDGKRIEVVPTFSSGMICHPLPFPFEMKPRSEAAKTLIEQTEMM